MTDEYDPTASFHGGDPNSEAAFRNTSSSTRSHLRVLILRTLRERGGRARCQQVEDWLEKKHETLSARFTELFAAGEVVVVGHEPNVSGRLARVYKRAEDADPSEIIQVKPRSRRNRDAEDVGAARVAKTVRIAEVIEQVSDSGALRYRLDHDDCERIAQAVIAALVEQGAA